MPFESLRSVSVDLKEPNKSVQGYYVGRKDIQTKLGAQVVWELQSKDGTRIGVYGFTSLNRQMETAPLGMMLRITYLGKEMRDTKFGRKEVHQARVEIDRTDIIAVQAPAIPSTPSTPSATLAEDAPF